MQRTKLNKLKRNNRILSRLALSAALWLAAAGGAQALDKTLTLPGGTVDFNNDGAWSGGSKAGVGDNAWLTNAITAARTVTNGAASTTVDNLIISNSESTVTRIMTLLLSNQTFTVANTGTIGRQGALNLKTNVTATFGNLVLENTSAAGTDPSVTVALGSRLQVNGTGTLSAGVLNLGTGTSGSLLSTAVFNNLTMANTASILFNATAAANRGPDTLIVTGRFQNATGNIIRSAGVNGGNGLSLVFLNGQAGTATVTNNGIIAASWGQTANYGAMNIQATGSSTDSRTNYFLNKGTMSLVFNGAIVTANTYTNQWVMNLVNEGSLLISNLNTATAGGRSATIQVSLSGSEAATNLGTIAFFSTNQLPASPNIQNVIDFRVTNGFVNAGTLTSLSPAISGNAGFTNFFTVTSGTFSNAGTVSTGVGGMGGFAIRANRIVNTGTNLVNSGTLLYQRSDGTAGILENSGTILITGANLTVAGGITNTGNIIGYGSVTGAVYNTGVISNTSAGTLTLAAGLRGSTNFGTLAIGGTLVVSNGAGGLQWLTNSGTVNLLGGTIVDKEFVNLAGGQLNTYGGLISNALQNAGYWNIVSGVTTATPDVNNLSTGVITNSATLQVGSTGTGPVVNQNSFVMNNGTLLAGSVTNTSAGTFQLATGNSGTVQGATFVNQGTVALVNGQTLTINGGTLTNTTSGLVIGNGGNLVFQNASFYNQSLNTTNSVGSTLVFTNSGGNGNFFMSTASKDIDQYFPSTNNNYFVAAMTLQDNSYLDITPATGQNAGDTKAFYVDILTINSGATLDLNGLNLYYGTLFNSGTILNAANGGQQLIAGTSDSSFVPTATGQYDFNTGSSWDTNPTVPGSTFSTYATNAISGNVVITNGAPSTTVKNLVISNSTAFTHTLLLSNNVLTVNQNTTIGRNGVVQLGAGNAAATMSNTTLTLANGGTILFTNGDATAVNQLVASTLSSASGSTITMAGASGATNLLLVTGGAFANNGYLNSAGGTNIIRASAASNAGTNALTGGTLLYQDTGGSALPLVNTGTVLLNGGGLSVAALTNASGGIVFGNTAASTLTGDLVNQAGGVVSNTGATWTMGIVKNSGRVVLHGGGLTVTALTNASGGVVFGNTGVSSLTGDLINQAGGVVSNAGATWTMGIIQNSGTLVLHGGGLTVTALTNATGGIVFGNTGASALAGAVINQTGGVISNNGAAWSLSGTFSNLGTFVVNNSGLVTNTGAVSLGGSSTSRVENATWVAQSSLVVGDSGDRTALVLTNNGTLRTLSAVTIGNAANSNSVTVAGNSLWNAGGANLTVGNGAATGNVLAITGGTVTNMNILNVAGASGSGTLTLNAGNLFVQQLLVTNNTATATNSFFTFGGGTLTTSNAANAVAAQIVIPSNTAFVIKGTWNMNGGSNLYQEAVSGTALSTYIGNSASLNAVNVRTGAVWNVGGLGLLVGASSAAGSNNTLTVNSGVVTNIGLLQIGSGGASSNQMLLSNGARVTVNSLIIGSVSSNNVVTVGGLGDASTLTVVGSGGGAVLSVGSGNASGSYNTLTITNGTLVWSGSASSFRLGANVGHISNTVYILAGGVLSGSGTLNNDGVGNQMVINGGLWTNAGVVLVSGNGGSSGGLTVFNGGQLVGTQLDMRGSNNFINIGGAGLMSTGTLSGVVNVGTTSTGYNQLTVTNALFTTGGGTIGSGSSNNTATVRAGGTWNLGNNTLTVGSGAATGNQLVLRGLSTTTVQRVLINNANTLTFLGGVMNVSSLLSNGSGGALVLGDGTQTAILNMNNSSLRALNGVTIAHNGTLVLSGTATISNTPTITVGPTAGSSAILDVTGLSGGNFTLANNQTLRGSGTVQGNLTITNAGYFSPGNSPGTLTNIGVVTYASGGHYVWEVNQFSGAAGADPGWDLEHITGTLNITATSGSQFNLDITSLKLDNTAGLVSDFQNDEEYTATILRTTGGITGFAANKFLLNFAAFSNSFDGPWTLLQAGNDLILNYAGSTNYVWNNGPGNFNTPGNWQAGLTPPTQQSNLVVYFGGTGSQQYTATNDLTGLALKRLIATNNSSATQYLVGNSLALVGLTPGLVASGTGAFVISNSVVISSNTFVGVNNTGTLELDGSISGGGGLTKTGAYTAVLGGANTYNGSTLVNDGTLAVRHDSALAGSTQTLVSAGTLLLDGGTPVVRRLAGTGNVVLTNGATAVLSNATAGSVYSGIISGGGGLLKAGSSTLTLSGNSTYTGNTTVNGGTLTVNGQLQGSPNLIVNGGGNFIWNNVNAMTNTVQVAVFGASLNGLYFQTDAAIGGLTGNGGVIMAGHTLEYGYGNGSSLYSGTFGGGTLTLVGAGTLTLDHFGSVGSLDHLNVTNGMLVVRDSAELGVTAAGSASTLAISNAGVFIVTASGQLTASNLVVRSGGSFSQQLTAASVTLANLQVGSGGTYSLAGGTLTVTTTAGISNGTDFTVGSLATFKVNGTAHLEQNLINSGTLAGAGTIVVNGGNGTVYIQAGAVQAPGNSPGTQTVVGTNIWQAAGSYQWEINDWAGSQGSNPGWDWLNVIGVLSNDATQLNPFIIDITSLNGTVAGLSANFNTESNYTKIIATGVSVANFATNLFTLTTVNFANAYDGDFRLALQDTTNVVLSYVGTDEYVWTDVTGNFSVPGNWRDGAAPPTGKTNVVLYFGGSTVSGYVANNNLTGLFTKRLILTNNTATLQTIAGNNFTLVGLTPGIEQNGTGAFLINNDVVLSATALLTGTGSGTVELAGTWSGSGGLTKTGSWTLVLSGANTYNGVTTMRDGQLLVANANALQNTTLSNLVHGGVVFTNVTTANIGGLTGTGNLGLTNTGGAAVTMNVGGNSASTRYDGVLSGLGSVVKVGSGNLVLGSANTYQGGTVVSAGTLTAAEVGNGIGSTGSSLGSGGLQINGGTMRFGNGSLLPVTNTVSGQIVFYGGTLTAAGVYNVGQITVRGGNNTLVSDLYNSGVLSNAAGTLNVGATGTGMVTNSGTIALSGGVLEAGTVTNTGRVVGYGTLSAALANSLLVSATNGQLNLDGVVSGAGTFRAEPGATLSFNGGGSLSSLFNTGGTIRVASVLTNTATFNNAGTLAPAGGTYYTPTMLTNGATARIIGYGTVAAAGTLMNQGTINNPFPTTPPGSTLVIDSALANTGFVGTDSGRKLIVSGVFTNDGTLSLSFAGLGTFNSSVVNRSAWLQSGGADSLFNNDVLVTSNGYLTADNGSVLTFKGNLTIQSTNNLAWDTTDALLGTNVWNIGTGAKFLFSGASVTQTQVFQTPGLLLTGGFSGSPVPSTNGVQDVTTLSAVSGFNDNFAVGQLWLTNTTLSLAPTVPLGPMGSLFVQDLFLFGGAKLVINDNLRLYFVNSNSWNMSSITLLGSAEIHQLNPLLAESLAVPEPSVLVMWLAGGITLWTARRRRQSLSKLS